MAEVFPEKPLVRCSGCGFSHDSCERQQDAERFIHRAYELLNNDPETHDRNAWLDEYEQRWA